MRAVTCAALLLISTGLAACDDAVTGCTLIGCSTEHAITLFPASAPFPAGAYEVRVTDGGETRTCSFTLDISETGPNVADVTGACTSAFPIQDASGARSGVRASFPMGGREARISVARGEAVLADARVAVAYEEVYANGPNCGVTCRVAQTELEIPAK